MRVYETLNSEITKISMDGGESQGRESERGSVIKHVYVYTSPAHFQPFYRYGAEPKLLQRRPARVEVCSSFQHRL